MAIKTFNEIIEHSTKEFYYNLFYSSDSISLPDLKMNNHTDHYFKKEYPQILFNEMMKIIEKNPVNAKIFFTNSKKKLIEIYSGEDKEDLIYSLFSHIFDPYSPNRDPSFFENELILYVIDSLNNYMPNYVSTFNELYNDFYLSHLDSSNTSSNESKNISNKLKTNLTVKELSALFRLLDEVKPNMFEYKNKTEIYRFITRNFITKGKDGTEISENSVKNHFNTIDYDTSVTWESYFNKIIKVTRDFKQK